MDHLWELAVFNMHLPASLLHVYNMLLPRERRALTQPWVQFKDEIPTQNYFFVALTMHFGKSWGQRDRCLAWWKNMPATQISHINSRVKMIKGNKGEARRLGKTKMHVSLWTWIGLVGMLDIRKTLGAKGRFVQVKQESPILSVWCHLHSSEAVCQSQLQCSR